MASIKKFGTFTGVFTPSILTILGVIMYLRLGWVVGQAGLIATIGIIILAHIISVSTGLSISSIATDKKIKTGGIYYILSRSLGLPIGGSIGITLFIGTALSVALYIVGFVESFLAIDAIRTFFNLGTSLNDIRIVGTIVIVALVIIAFISTSLALKMQYFVLVAIALSLVSILGGLFTNTTFLPEVSITFPFPDGVPLEVVFAIFFPAVTGFTAGVAMSGDLKNSNKSIPRGTMYSIIVGLVVYIVLAIAFALFVDREVLINDVDFIYKIALSVPFVVAGVWGATISSALGGILGAPRILQAISKDNLVPKIFAKGYGVSDEPRNALIFSFIIAEIGILIGDLNVIARVVSMFYIAAYGFINLAYVLEKWASSDFRPTFSVPKWIGIVGFVASFGVMFKLDTVAMIVALFIMFLIYILLKRKELKFDFGDVWQSVWSTLVRNSLQKMDSKKLEDRNWRPNIILFSGNKAVRPHLIDFGKMLVGQHGFLSDFELIENRDKDSVLPKSLQTVKVGGDKQGVTGVFSRQERVNDIYEGIVSISRYYGFSGVEPNTVMLGWGRHTKDPQKFANMVNNLNRLDLNILMMDYDNNVGFGDYKTIDIWWRGSNNNGSFALSIIRFLWLSDEYRNAKVRLLIVNHTNDKRIQIEQKANAVLSNLRLPAEVKVINNEIERRSFYEIIKTESINTDLTFLGIPDVVLGKEAELVSRINTLCEGIGTVVLMKASSTFKEIDLGVDSAPIKLENRIKPIIEQSISDVATVQVENKELAFASKQFFDELSNVSNEITDDYLRKLFNYQDELLYSYYNIINEIFVALKREVIEVKNIAKEYEKILFEIKQLILHHQNDISNIQKNILQQILILFSNGILDIANKQKERLDVFIPIENYKINDNDSLAKRLYKMQRRLLSWDGKQYVKCSVYFRNLIIGNSQAKMLSVFEELLKHWGAVNIQFFIEFGKLIDNVANGIISIENNSNISYDDINKNYEKFKEGFTKIKNLNVDSYNDIAKYVKNEFSALESAVNSNLNELRINASIPKIHSRKILKQKKDLALIPEKWFANQNLILNNLYLEVALFSFGDNIEMIFYDTASDIENVIEYNLLNTLYSFEELLNQQELNPEKIIAYITDNDFSIGSLKVALKDIIENAFSRVSKVSSDFPEHLILMSEDSINKFHQQQYNNVDEIDVFVRRLIDSISQKEIISPLQDNIKNISDELELILLRLNNLLKQIIFGISDESFESDYKTKQQSVIDIEDEKRKFHEEIDNIRRHMVLIKNFYRDRTAALESALSLTSFIRNIKNLTQYVKEQEKKKRLYKVIRITNKIDSFIRKQICLVWFRHSKGLILANSIKQRENSNYTTVDDVLSIRNHLFVSKKQIDKIPFYYQQLFLRKHYYIDDFWVGRERELKQVEQAFSNYQKGFKGGMLVLGERNSGRSFFAMYSAKKYTDKNNIYTLYAPYSGSISVSTFKSHLQRTFDNNGSYDNIFGSLKENSIVIFEDIELWWEKSENGHVVIDEIINIIDKYSNKCFFIVTANCHSFKIINTIQKIESYFINIINLEPFNAEEIKDIIVKRHVSSNMHFELNNNYNKYFISWHNAKLFNRYYHFSGGNVGVVLNAWITNIIDVDDNLLKIKYPEIPDDNKLDFLETDWLILIVQFILHKRLTVSRLIRITLENKDILLSRLNILKRAGLISENNDGVYELDQYLYPVIKKKLIEKEVL